jgi:hypothetical protein
VCPICRPNSRNFGRRDGYIAWFPDEWLIRLIGPDCFAEIDKQGHADAVEELEKREARERDSVFLVSQRVEARLRDLALMDDTPEALEAEALLAAMHRETGKSIVHGLTALRATPRSRMAPREGRAKFERGPGPFRPWEIVPRKSDGQAP